MSTSVDWSVAQRRASGVVPPGPRAGREELLELVATLRDAARRAPEHVAEVTGLHAAAERAANGPVQVIDRPRWVQVNLQMFRHLVEDVLPLPAVPGAARIAGEEMGLVLAFLSTKVLGQFDPYTPLGRDGTASPSGNGSSGNASPSGNGSSGNGFASSGWAGRASGGSALGTGRLVLVAPNVLQAERQMRLDPADFRLWVCLHEQTHAVQFGAAPWLAEHIGARVRELVTGLEDLGRDTDRLHALVEALPRILRGRSAGVDDDSLSAHAILDVMLDAEQRSEVAGIVATMSLLEGHADVVMDARGPELIRTLPRIRSRFEARRDGRGPLDVLLRRLLGLDAKVAQYRTGAAFVRGVVDRLGHEGLNAVWTGPGALPSAAEILDPAAWVRRIHG